MVFLKKDEIISLLMELKNYMDSYADVDGDSQGNYPNEEASFMAQIDLAIETLERSELTRDKMNESKKKTIRLTETELIKFIKNTTKKIMNEDEMGMDDEEINYEYTQENLEDKEIDFTNYDTAELTLMFDDGVNYVFEVEFRNAGDSENMEIELKYVRLLEPTVKKLNLEKFEEFLMKLDIHDSLTDGIADYIDENTPKSRRSKYSRDPYGRDEY
jgi:hypothetical protein